MVWKQQSGTSVPTPGPVVQGLEEKLLPLETAAEETSVLESVRFFGKEIRWKEPSEQRIDGIFLVMYNELKGNSERFSQNWEEIEAEEWIL